MRDLRRPQNERLAIRPKDAEIVILLDWVVCFAFAVGAIWELVFDE
jgi:hypothetical protein